MKPRRLHRLTSFSMEAVSFLSSGMAVGIKGGHKEAWVRVFASTGIRMVDRHAMELPRTMHSARRLQQRIRRLVLCLIPWQKWLHFNRDEEKTGHSRKGIHCGDESHNLCIENERIRKNDARKRH